MFDFSKKEGGVVKEIVFFHFIGTIWNKIVSLWNNIEQIRTTWNNNQNFNFQKKKVNFTHIPIHFIKRVGVNNSFGRNILERVGTCDANK